MRFLYTQSTGTMASVFAQLYIASEFNLVFEEKKTVRNPTPNNKSLNVTGNNF
jgi:hypothetical protein